MIIVAILKHVAGKSADYGAALDYLKYEHDEVLKKTPAGCKRELGTPPRYSSGGHKL